MLRVLYEVGCDFACSLPTAVHWKASPSTPSLSRSPPPCSGCGSFSFAPALVGSGPQILCGPLDPFHTHGFTGARTASIVAIASIASVAPPHLSKPHSQQGIASLAPTDSVLDDDLFGDLAGGAAAPAAEDFNFSAYISSNKTASKGGLFD